MNREDLFSAITDIRDDYIVQADPAKRTPAPLHRKLQPWLSMAAALIVVVGLVALAKNLPMFQSKQEPTAEEATMALPGALLIGVDDGTNSPLSPGERCSSRCMEARSLLTEGSSIEAGWAATRLARVV